MDRRIPQPNSNRRLPLIEVRLDLFVKGKKWDHAFPVAEALHHAFPDDPRILYKLAIVVLNLGQEERACELMAKAIENSGTPGCSE